MHYTVSPTSLHSKPPIVLLSHRCFVCANLTKAVVSPKNNADYFTSIQIINHKKIWDSRREQQDAQKGLQHC